MVHVKGSPKFIGEIMISGFPERICNYGELGGKKPGLYAINFIGEEAEELARSILFIAEELKKDAPPG